MQNGTEKMTAYNDFSAFAKVLHKKKMKTNESRESSANYRTSCRSLHTEIHNFAQYNLRM